MAKVKIVALLPLYRFGLPQSEGQEVEVDSKQADELIEAGYAKKHDPKAEVKAAKIAELTAAIEEAKTVLAGLAEDASDEDKVAATKAVEDAEKALAKETK